MKKKTVFMLGATAILGAAMLDVVNVPAVNEPTVVYAATTTQKTALRQAKSYYKKNKNADTTRFLATVPANSPP